MTITLIASSQRIYPTSLTQSAFAPFGTVVTNPHNDRDASQRSDANKGISANQGTAIKFPSITQLTNSYRLAPSRAVAETFINLFACSPRPLRRSGEATETVKRAVGCSSIVDNFAQSGLSVKGNLLFDVNVLERHPYTSQTFVPMGLSATDQSTCYLVIVAPTLPKESSEPMPAVETSSGKGLELPQHWSGLPDLSQVRAFVARGDRAVTYAAGTWHAPMVVLGQRAVDFVVMQWANGVADEDCQEVYLEGRAGTVGGLAVSFDLPPPVTSTSLDAKNAPKL